MAQSKTKRLNFKDLREQCEDIARKFNTGQKVELVELASILEQLIAKLDESQLPTEHQHYIEVKSGNAILK